ncbi:hypothetical protein D3C76_51650 [compost metagenome]
MELDTGAVKTYTAQQKGMDGMATIEIEVRNIGTNRSWKESYDCSHNDPEEWDKNLIDHFNATLHPGERARELVGVEILDGSEAIKNHVWRKVNAITIVRGGQSYDKVRCELCGITGKRFGLSGITRDSKYKAKKYIKCQG